MKFVIQRVLNASLCINNTEYSSIHAGLVVFIGISNQDNSQIADKMIKKMLNLRIFEDENQKTNLSLATVKGELLLVSQFTLYADCKHGNRPSFTQAGNPDDASLLYHYIISECKKAGYPVKTGVFGADMQIKMLNQGPFTMILDSDDM